ncbi:MAG: hypothetical protein ACU84H_13700 [Gammaproteobacteria bacterium]
MSPNKGKTSAFWAAELLSVNDVRIDSKKENGSIQWEGMLTAEDTLNAPNRAIDWNLVNIGPVARWIKEG